MLSVHTYTPLADRSRTSSRKGIQSIFSRVVQEIHVLLASETILSQAILLVPKKLSFDSGENQPGTW